MEKKIILMAVPLEDLIMKKLKEKSTLNQELVFTGLVTQKTLLCKEPMLE